MRFIIKLFIGLILIVALMVLVGGILLLMSAPVGSVNAQGYGPLGIQNPPLYMAIAGGVLATICLLLLFKI